MVALILVSGLLAVAVGAAVAGLGVWAIVTQRPQDGISPLVAHLYRRTTVGVRHRSLARRPVRLRMSTRAHRPAHGPPRVRGTVPPTVAARRDSSR